MTRPPHAAPPSTAQFFAVPPGPGSMPTVPPHRRRAATLFTAAVCCAWVLSASAPAAHAGPAVDSAVPTLRGDAGTGVAVPYDLPAVDAAGGGPVAVRLYASGDGGRTWAVAATVDPSAGGVRFLPELPGEYALALRTLDAAGRPHPPGPLSPELRVRIADGTPPLPSEPAAGLIRPAAGAGGDGGVVPLGEFLRAPEFAEDRRVRPTAGDDGPRDPFAPRVPTTRRDSIPALRSPGVPAGTGDTPRYDYEPAAERTAVRDGVGTHIPDVPVSVPPDAPPEARFDRGDAAFGAGRDGSSRDPVSPAGEPWAGQAGSPPRRELPPAPAGEPWAGVRPSERAFGDDLTDGRELSAADGRVLLGAARNAVKRGELAEAGDRFRRYLAAFPGDAGARAELAGVLIQGERFADAAAEYELLLAARPDDAAALLGYADLLVRMNRLETARGHLRSLLGRPEVGTAAAVRLARTFLIEDRPADAVRVYDTHLAVLAPADPQLRGELARLLVQMNRPAEARRMLVPLHEARPTDAAVLCDLVLCHARLMDRSGALGHIDALGRLPVADPGLWLGLAEELFRDGAYVEALPVYRQILASIPDHHRARVGAAHTHLKLWQLAAARSELEAVSHLRGDVRYEAAFTEYRVVSGEWAEGIADVRARLKDSPADPQARLDLGHLFNAGGQYVRAEAAYAAAANLRPTDAETVAARAKNLADAREFPRAIGLLDALLSRRPGDLRVRLLLADVLTEAKQFDRAAAVLAVPPDVPLSPRQRFAVRTRSGRLLVETGHPTDAARALGELAGADATGDPTVRYHLYRSLRALGQHERAKAALFGGCSPLSGDAHDLITTAALALGDCRCCLAGELLDRLLKFEPEHPAALNLRGETTLMCCPCEKAFGCSVADDQFRGRAGGGYGAGCGSGCGTGACGGGGCSSGGCSSGGCGADGFTGAGPCGCETGDHFKRLLAVDPENSRARRGLARAHAAHLEYKQSFRAYDLYLAGLPGDANTAREKARLVDNWRGYPAAAPIYDGLMRSLNPDGLITPGGLFGADIPGLELEYEALSDLSTVVATEKTAKYLRPHRPSAAIPVYEGLIAEEPWNQDAYFDLAQTWGAKNCTRDAEAVYRRLLKVNPCHREAKIALERHRLWRRPQATAGYSFQNLDGRDGLADLRTQTYTVAGVMPLGDEEELLTAGYSHVVFGAPRALPIDEDRLHGEIGFVSLARRLRPDVLAFGRINVEEHDFLSFSTRPTFNAGLKWTGPKDAQFRLFALGENVALNRESLRQDINRVGFQTDLFWLPTRRWQLDAFYRLTDYSDDNRGHEFGVHNGYVLVPGRKQLRARADIDALFFREFTVRGAGVGPFGDRGPGASGLVGARHPYFNPQDFVFGTLGLEYKRWLSCDTFKGANQLWYEVYGGARFDSRSDSYALFTAKLNWDVFNQFTVTAETGFIASEVYDEQVAALSGTWRFR